MSWRAALDAISARGALVARPGSLAGLAAARAAHEGQFFTPTAVVDLLWHLLGAATGPRAVAGGWNRPCRVIDTAAGTGRLLGPCRPATHAVWAIEVDPDCAGPLARAHAAAGFAGHVVHGRLEEHRIAGFDLALLNPPFSLHWDSPTLERFPVNAHGRYGSASAATSQWYAVAQACAAARVVGAVVPRQMADDLLDQSAVEDGRGELRRQLRCVVHLPGSAFRSEGATVRTALLVFADPGAVDHPGVRVDTLRRLDQAALVPIAWRSVPASRRVDATMTSVDLALTTPAITRPVTGDRRVHLGHSGRRLTLGFRCGTWEAIVRNRILVARLPRRIGTRSTGLPASVVYDGQGRLDLEVHLAQPDPAASLAGLVADIARTGAQVSVDPGILPYLRRRARRSAREAIPMRRWAWLPEADLDGWIRGQEQITVAARGACAIGARILAAGDRVTLARIAPTSGVDPRWQVAGSSGSIPHALLAKLFAVQDAPAAGWRLLHQGLRAGCPATWHAAQRRAQAAGVDRFLTRGYQLDDLIELTARGRGICGWFMALGKARLALALALTSGQHNLIVVEARLIPEMRSEIAAIGLAETDWQEITSAADTRALRRVNLISYSRLKQPLGGFGSGSHDTIARRLRHRISALVADEAHSLRNQSSDQTRACLQIAPKHAYDLSGTPIANYPRDILPLLRHCQGDGTVSQPYGQHHPLLGAEQARSMRGARRGNEAFADLFCVLEWVTNEFMDELGQGAKREIVDGLADPHAHGAHCFRRRMGLEEVLGQDDRRADPDGRSGDQGLQEAAVHVAVVHHREVDVMRRGNHRLRMRRNMRGFRTGCLGGVDGAHARILPVRDFVRRVPGGQR